MPWCMSWPLQRMQMLFWVEMLVPSVCCPPNTAVSGSRLARSENGHLFLILHWTCKQSINFWQFFPADVWAALCRPKQLEMWLSQDACPCVDPHRLTEKNQVHSILFLEHHSLLKVHKCSSPYLEEHKDSRLCKILSVLLNQVLRCFSLHIQNIWLP